MPPLAGSSRPVAHGDRRDTDRIHTKIVVPFVQISNSTSLAKSKPVSETRISSLKDGIWSNDSEDRSRYTITNMSSRSGHQSPDLPALIARIFPSVNQPISIIAIWDFDKIPIVKMPHSGPPCSDKIRRPNGPCPRLFFSGGAATRPVRSTRFSVVRSHGPAIHRAECCLAIFPLPWLVPAGTGAGAAARPRCSPPGGGNGIRLNSG